MTFNYNLARLNLDTRHTGAGLTATPSNATTPTTLSRRKTLTAYSVPSSPPTTLFCPQTHTLTIGSFRAWNGLSERHEYDLIRVRAASMHHQSEAINEQLADRGKRTSRQETTAGQEGDTGDKVEPNGTVDEERGRAEDRRTHRSEGSRTAGTAVSADGNANSGLARDPSVFEIASSERCVRILRDGRITTIMCFGLPGSAL